ncbi:MAG: hypothetical protein IPK33_00720 [Gemmatimonadetes bacterium]|nr:hypothetical protein [Gemmatimonadota bacterium]
MKMATSASLASARIPARIASLSAPLRVRTTVSRPSSGRAGGDELFWGEPLAPVQPAKAASIQRCTSTLTALSSAWRR